MPTEGHCARETEIGTTKLASVRTVTSLSPIAAFLGALRFLFLFGTTIPTVRTALVPLGNSVFNVIVAGEKKRTQNGVKRDVMALTGPQVRSWPPGPPLASEGRREVGSDPRPALCGLTSRLLTPRRARSHRPSVQTFRFLQEVLRRPLRLPSRYVLLPCDDLYVPSWAVVQFRDIFFCLNRASFLVPPTPLFPLWNFHLASVED